MGAIFRRNDRNKNPLQQRDNKHHIIQLGKRLIAIGMLIIFQRAQFFHQHTLAIAMQFRLVPVFTELFCDILFIGLIPCKYAKACQTLVYQREYNEYGYEPSQNCLFFIFS